MCSTLATLISAVGMSAKPKIIDLTKKFGTAEKLTEARVNCALEEKVCGMKKQRNRKKPP